MTLMTKPILVLLTGLCLAMPAAAQDFLQAAPQKTDAQPSQTPSQTLSTSGDSNWVAKQKDQTIGTAATAPLDDLNLRQQQIPPILTAAASQPYALDGLTTCADLNTEILQLTDVLGEDIDAAAAPKVTGGEKTREMAGNATLDTVRATTTGIIPFRGWVRKLSGAERHQKEVDAAITAGQIRRAFLKGVGMQRNCAPPAAPADFVPVRTASKTPARTRKTAH